MSQVKAWMLPCNPHWPTWLLNSTADGSRSWVASDRALTGDPAAVRNRYYPPASGRGSLGSTGQGDSYVTCNTMHKLLR